MNLANLFAEKGNTVSLLVLDDTSQSFYPLNKKIHLVHLSLSFGITREGNVFSRKIKLLSDVLKLRKILKTIMPGLIIATEYPLAVAAVLTGTGKRSKLVSWEHHHYYAVERNSFWNKLYKFAYPRLSGVVCLNAEEKKLFSAVNENTVVIPNFIQSNPAHSTLNNKTILTVGHLSKVKGTDLLLAVAAIVSEKHPGWKWKLIGSNINDDSISETIRKTTLPAQLFIEQPVDHDIWSEYEAASIYVMTSRNECFPMTLLEAMRAGLPCIAFDCDTGPRHIIINGENGLLVGKENVQQMADSISTLIGDEEKRKKLGAGALKTITRFSPDTVYQLWERLF